VELKAAPSKLKAAAVELKAIRAELKAIQAELKTRPARLEKFPEVANGSRKSTEYRQGNIGRPSRAGRRGAVTFNRRRNVLGRRFEIRKNKAYGSTITHQRNTATAETELK